jgi:hypothetical protein
VAPIGPQSFVAPTKLIVAGEKIDTMSDSPQTTSTVASVNRP